MIAKNFFDKMLRVRLHRKFDLYAYYLYSVPSPLQKEGKIYVIKPNILFGIISV